MRNIRIGVVAGLMLVAVGCGSPASVVPSGSGSAATSSPTPTPSPTPRPEYQAPTDLVVGSCFDPIEDRDDQNLLAGIIRRCNEPHLMEVIGLPELDHPPSAPYPAVRQLDAEAEELCRAEFASYVGIDYDDSQLSASFYTPSSETWVSGDRLVTCVVDAADVAPLTRSVRGSRA